MTDRVVPIRPERLTVTDWPDLEEVVDIIANVPDENGNAMMYEDDAKRILATLEKAGYLVGRNAREL